MMKRRGTKEFYRDREKLWRWRVRASNGRIVAESGEGYNWLGDAEHGMKVAFYCILFGRKKIK